MRLLSLYITFIIFLHLAIINNIKVCTVFTRIIPLVSHNRLE